MPSFNREGMRTHKSVPSWLVNEPLSSAGDSVREEWVRVAQSANVDEGKARLATAMLRMQSQRPVRPLLAEANTRALRWVDSAVRRTREARRLQEVNPSLRFSQRILLCAHQSFTTTAAALVLICCKAGVFGAVESLSRITERLAALHIDRHIDPPVS